MSPSLFWLADGARATIEPNVQDHEPRARRVDHRSVISGHMPERGGRSADPRPEYGPSATVYNRRNRRSHRRTWTCVSAARRQAGWIAETGRLDSRYIRAHRSAGGDNRTLVNSKGIRRGGRTTKIHALVDRLGRPPRLVPTRGSASDVGEGDLLIAETIGMKRMIAQRGFHANRVGTTSRDQDTIPVIPGPRNRPRPVLDDERRNEDRWRLEAMFSRSKDFRHVATRNDKGAGKFPSREGRAAALAFLLRSSLHPEGLAHADTPALRLVAHLRQAVHQHNRTMMNGKCTYSSTRWNFIPVRSVQDRVVDVCLLDRVDVPGGAILVLRQSEVISSDVRGLLVDAFVGVRNAGGEKPGHSSSEEVILFDRCTRVRTSAFGS